MIRIERMEEVVVVQDIMHLMRVPGLVLVQMVKAIEADISVLE